MTREEAKAAGFKTYIGVVCKRGHEPAIRRAGYGDCVACSKERVAEWQKANPERSCERSKRHYHRHIDKLRPIRARKSKEYRISDPVKAQAAVKAAKAKKPELYNAHCAKWKREHPEHRSVMEAKRRALQANCEGSHTITELEELFKKQRGKCANCKVSIKDGYQRDHIMPLSLGGSNHIQNIQLLCTPKQNSCNQKKHAKHPIAFALENGRLV